MQSNAAASPTQPFPVWVVHAPKLTERKAACAAALEALGWTAQWIEHPTAEDLGLAFWARTVRNVRLTRGEVSIYAKHMAVLGCIAREGTPALVLEDDPIFGADFAQRAAPYFAAFPDVWDLVCLGASGGMELPAEPAHPLFARAMTTRSMSGYVVTADAARRIVGALRGRKIRKQIDLTVNELVAPLGLRIFWSVPALIENGSEAGRYPRSLTAGGWRRYLPARLFSTRPSAGDRGPGERA
jgi:GR25 family glycosyltransferase involved in LPS biosynthesis